MARRGQGHVHRAYVSGHVAGTVGTGADRLGPSPHPGTIPHEHPSLLGGTVTPETLHDALSLGMALRRHWQQPRGETGSDHEPSTVHFEGNRIVVFDRGHRQYLLTFRPYQRPPDPAVSTDYCPWVIDNDPDEGEIRCGTELRATTGPRGTFESVCTSGHRFVRCCCQARDCTGWRTAVTPGPHMPGIVP